MIIIFIEKKYAMKKIIIAMQHWNIVIKHLQIN